MLCLFGRRAITHRSRTRLLSAQMLTYYRTVADRSPLPVVLYNIPKFTHYDLPVEVVAELAFHPNIIGLKDSSGSVVRIAAVVAATGAVAKSSVAVTQIFEAVTGAHVADSSPVNGSSRFVSAGELGSGGTALASAPPRPALKTRTRQVGFQVLAGSAGHLVKSLDAGATGAVLALAAALRRLVSRRIPRGRKRTRRSPRKSSSASWRPRSGFRANLALRPSNTPAT